jgi:intracellular multiplication protein IcmK
MVSPLTPSEIRELHQDFLDTRQAKAQHPIETVPHISAVSVDLSPGASPPIARTMPGETTTLVFLDATGAPWPLAAQPWLSNKNYDVMWLQGTPDVVIAAHSMFEGANLAVFLVGLPTPVVVKLSSGEPDSKDSRRDVDYRLDLRVPGRGPNAHASIMGDAKINLYDDVLQAVLDGTPPAEAKPVQITGEQPARTAVWQIGNALYLRTPLMIESAYDQTMASADGMHVYKLALTPIVTVSSGGQSIPLTLSID